MKKTVLITVMIALTLVSCIGKAKDFSKAKLGMTQDSAKEFWGEPSHEDNMLNKKLINWQSSDKFSLSLWFNKGENKASSITVLKYKETFNDSDKWLLIEQITGNAQNVWEKKGTTVNLETVYGCEGVELLMSKRLNGFILIRGKVPQMLTNYKPE